MLNPRSLQRHSLGLLTSMMAMVAVAQNSPQARPRTLDRVIAVINDEVITRSEFDRQRRAVASQLQRQNTPLPNNDVLDRQVLERFINEKVELQHAKETGIRVDEGQIDAGISQLARDNNMSLDEFGRRLQQDGLVMSQFREEVRNDLTLKRLRDREIDARVVVTEAEIDNYLTTAKTQGVGSDEVQLAHIIVMVPEQASAQQLASREARAADALAALKRGDTFAQVAAVFSDTNDATQGGVIGWRAVDRIPQLYSEAIAALKPGETTPVLKSPNGFHIVRLMDRRGNEVKTIVDQNKARHILVKVNELVSESEARAKIDRMRDRLVSGSAFADVAKAGSEDASNARGGDLGWTNPGDLVPEFEKAMNALKIGELSAPVRSPFGWHLIEVTERRSQDITKDRTRGQARQALRDRKADESYQDWLRQLRDRAFVELKLED